MPRPMAARMILALTLLAPLPAAAASGAGATRRAYYAVRYRDEHGPFATRRDVVHAALLALQAHAEAEEWWTEWLIVISRDRYGKYWHGGLKEARIAGPGLCEASYSLADVRRPGSTLIGTAHTHPRGDVFPDPRPSPPDNQNAHEMFLLRSDGGVWYFRPHTTHATLYGHVRGSAVVSLPCSADAG